MDDDETQKFLASFFGLYQVTGVMLLATIISYTLEEFKKLKGSGTVEFIQTIPGDYESALQKMNKINSLLFECQMEKRNFLRTYPIWMEARQSNIKKLKEIANFIDTDQKNGNIASTASGVGKILGGACLIFAVIFPPAAPALVPTGLTITGLSAATGIGTEITVSSLLQTHLTQAAKIKERDEEFFTVMSKWFKCSQKLVEAFEEYMGFSVARDCYKIVEKSNIQLDELDDLKAINRFDSDMKPLIQKCIESISPSKFAKTSAEMIVYEISFFFASVVTNKENSLTFNSTVKSQDFVNIHSGLSDDIRNTWGIIASKFVVGLRARSLIKDILSETKRGTTAVFGGIGITLGVTDVVLNSIKIQNNVGSEYATILYKVVDQLEKESQVVRSIFNELYSMDPVKPI